MSEFQKNILMMLITALLGAGISSLSTISAVKVGVDRNYLAAEKNYLAIEKLDDRVRKIETRPPEFLAAN